MNSSKQAAQPATLDLRLSERVERDIMTGVFAPGEWLREQDLSKRYGTSRPSIREALRMVAQSGFVEMHPWRGAQVIELNALEVLELTILMEEAYVLCARLAATRCDETLARELERLLAELEAAVAQEQDRAELYRISFSLGRRIGLAAKSRHAFRQLLQSGNLVLWHHRLVRPGDAQSDLQSLNAYRVLVAAVIRRQPEAAAAAARLVIILMRDLFGEPPNRIV